MRYPAICGYGPHGAVPGWLSAPGSWLSAARPHCHSTQWCCGWLIADENCYYAHLAWACWPVFCLNLKCMGHATCSMQHCAPSFCATPSRDSTNQCMPAQRRCAVDSPRHLSCPQPLAASFACLLAVCSCSRARWPLYSPPACKQPRATPRGSLPGRGGGWGLLPDWPARIASYKV
jgi:hypothetical protein